MSSHPNSTNEEVDRPPVHTVRERLYRVLAYWGLVIKELLPLLQIGDLVASIVTGLVAGLAAGLSPLPLWSFVPVFSGVVLLGLLITTPARLWDNDQDLIKRLRERLRPKLGVELDDPQLAPTGRATFVRLKVTNQGHEQVKDCEGKLVEVKPLQKTDVTTLPEPGQNLTWTTRGGENVRSLKRSINPGDYQFLDVAFTEDFLDEYASGKISSREVPSKEVERLLDDPSRSHYHFSFYDYESWKLPKGVYEVTVQVSAANVGVPTPISFRIVYEGGLKLYPEALDIADPLRL